MSGVSAGERGFRGLYIYIKLLLFSRYRWFTDVDLLVAAILLGPLGMLFVHSITIVVLSGHGAIQAQNRK